MKRGGDICIGRSISTMISQNSGEIQQKSAHALGTQRAVKSYSNKI